MEAGSEPLDSKTVNLGPTECFKVKPKLSELLRYVKPHAADKWEEIGIALELFDDDLDGEMLADIKRSGDQTQCFMAIMRRWLKTKSSEATWEALLDCLKEISGLDKAVESIENLVKSAGSSCETQFHASMSSSASNTSPVEALDPESIHHPMSIPLQQQNSTYGQPPLSICDPFSIKLDSSNSTNEQLPPVLDFSVKLKEGMTVRQYQWELAEPGIRGENYIFVAPTGSGKTLAAALVISEHLTKTRSMYDIEDATQSKVFFMVRTKPLANQQKSELAKLIPGAKVVHCVGERGWIYLLLPHSDIIVCTAGKLLVELQQGKLKISQISLLMIDECHHVTDSYQKVMLHYLEEKERGKRDIRLPQIIGLTASPGAGENKSLELKKTIEHLVTLCALTDATSGIKIVQSNRDELEEVVSKPSFTLDVLNHRNTNEEFISVVTKEMILLEQCLEPKLKFSCYPRWSQAYETSIRQQLNLLEQI